MSLWRALEGKLRHHATLLDRTYDSIIGRDLQGHIVFWNGGAVQLYGWSVGEVQGAVAQNLLQTRFPQPFEEITAEVIRTGRWAGELVYTTPNGTHLVMASSWVLQHDDAGTPVAILEINNHITARKPTAEELERHVLERTKQLTAINDKLIKEITERKRVEEELVALKDAMAAELSAMTRLHEFSTRLLASTGLQPLLEEVLNATIALQNADFGNVQLYNPEIQALEIVAQRGFQQDFLDYFRRVDNSASACGRALHERERVIIEDVQSDPAFEPHRQIAASAGFRAVQSTPLYSRSGESLGMISTHFRQSHRPSERDLRLTDLYARQAAEMIERKRAEDALLKAQAELAYTTRVMTLGELTVSIAHEVNQPLAAIVTNGNACLRWLAREVPDLGEARVTVERIIRDGLRAADVIRRIRMLAKRRGSQKNSLDLNGVIDAMVALVRSEVHKHHVLLCTELSAKLPLVLGDHVQLQQVILNLLMNGIEAMSAVTDRTRELQIRSQEYGSNEVLVAVQDAGTGLDPQQMNRLFEAFFTTKQGAIGLGLSISRTIIEAHGGRLWATPNAKHGATFQFTLPAMRVSGS